MNSFCRDRRMGQVLADSNLLTWFDLLYIYIYIARDVQTSICEYVRNTHTHTCHPTLLFLMIEQSWNILFPNSRRLILVEELLFFFGACCLRAGCLWVLRLPRCGHHPMWPATFGRGKEVFNQPIPMGCHLPRITCLALRPPAASTKCWIWHGSSYMPRSTTCSEVHVPQKQ